MSTPSIGTQTRLPALFIGHGSPMNAVQRNTYTESWSRISASLPKPRAILAISAHWYIPGTAVTANAMPPTIHDFGGFPRELFEMQYPAPGDPGLARRVQELLSPLDVALDSSWGLDHGIWSILCHMYPQADVPVVQLSMDARRAGPFHFDLGRKLAPLRDEGILVLGSGNLVHNLRTLLRDRRTAEPFDWAVRFESAARALMSAGDFQPLTEYEKFGSDALLSAPTPEHLLPLLYVLGTKLADDAITYPVEGVDGGSISMLSVQVG